MKSKTIVAVFFVILLSFPLFANSVVAQDDVVITIQGGLGVKFFIENNGNETVRANFIVTAKGPRCDVKDEGENIPIEPNYTFCYKMNIHHLVFISVSVDVVGHSSLAKKGIGFMYFAIFLTRQSFYY